MSKKIRQWEAVVDTMRNLGGIATLAQLNQEVFKIDNCEWKTKTPFASVRRIVQQTPKYIYKIRPGLYGLIEFRNYLEANGYIVENNKNKSSKVLQEFNHSYYQGILLELGNMKHFKTFIPNQDQNKQFDIHRTLGHLSTLPEIPNYTYQNLVHRSSTIDVIWFNEHKLPHSFFEIEHSTDIQNSLLKYNDLRYFYVDMYIVADEKREDEYTKKLSYDAFREINKRVKFLSYDKLMIQYNIEITKSSLSFIL